MQIKEESQCGVYTAFSSVWHLRAAQIFIGGIRNVKEVIAMIELTTAGYIVLIALSVLGGYTLHGVVDAIKKGEFFD